MYLHFDKDVFMQDITDFVDSFASGTLGYDKHQQLATRLRDEACTQKKLAKVTVAANCASCGIDVMRALHTIWQRGWPIEVSLLDGTCPHCQGKKGFHYGSHHSLHA